ncbi:dihydrolipoyl dehydrogenase family protein [Lichenicola sp.]|uniref:dihydrolipoyl dehydrogenase family protein n=1 Tax=Lichenicola sp. TaxID=2804529 RepID=UPI003AFFD821
MTERFDLVVIGAGAAGLTAAGGAALFGLKVALVEAGDMGGECLNTGCVPSKALIAAAARASTGRSGARLGVALGEPVVDFAAVRAHVDQAIARIAPEDSQERFEAMGVAVIRARARFLDRSTILAGNRRLKAGRFVIATGSRPTLPPIEGLAEAAPLTNETLFGLETLPSHLIVLGGGPVGIEMAQAFRRLGAAVTLIGAAPWLGREDREAVALVVEQLGMEGVVLLATQAIRVERDHEVRVHCANGEVAAGSHLLVATGRTANIETLDLAAAGVETGADGIVVDAGRRTSNRRILAIGDCRAGPRFTHVAGYEGALVAARVALGVRGKVDWRALPRVTYTDPELAQIGPTQAEAEARYGRIEVTREAFAHNHRAVTEGDTRGFLKLVRHRGRVVGVTIVGAHAGELLLPWAQVITGRSSSFALGSAVIAYPTRSEIAKAAAFATWQPALFGRWPKRWARLRARARSWRV